MNVNYDKQVVQIRQHENNHVLTKTPPPHLSKALN